MHWISTFLTHFYSGIRSIWARQSHRTNHIWWHPNDHHLEELMLSLTTLVSSHMDKSRPDSTDVSFHQSTLWMSVLQTCSCMVAYILYLSGLLVDQKSNRIKFDISLSLSLCSSLTVLSAQYSDYSAAFQQVTLNTLMSTHKKCG